MASKWSCPFLQHHCIPFRMTQFVDTSIDVLFNVQNNTVLMNGLCWVFVSCYCVLPSKEFWCQTQVDDFVSLGSAIFRANLNYRWNIGSTFMLGLLTVQAGSL